MNLIQKLHLKSEQLPTDIVFALIAFSLWLLSCTQVTDSLGPVEEFVFGIAFFSCVLAFFLRSGSANISTFVIFATVFLSFLLYPTNWIPADLCILFAVFHISIYGRATARFAAYIAALISGLLLSLPFALQEIDLNSLAYLLLNITAVVITAMLGNLQRLRLKEKAALQAQEIIKARNELRDVDLAVANERTRIAREMHDIVAHTLSVVIAQADGGRFAAKQNPQAAEQALETIAQMSRAALTDIRSIIGVLRNPDEQMHELRPQPIEHDIKTLVNRLKDSGKKISFIHIGHPRSLPAGLGNTLYRICQEALTNSLKHAGEHATIAVILKWKELNISLEIIDDGRGAITRNDGHGNGIIGMRERVAMFGGTIEAGPKAQGGFGVRVLIPTDRDTRTGTDQSATI